MKPRSVGLQRSLAKTEVLARRPTMAGGTEGNLLDDDLSSVGSVDTMDHDDIDNGKTVDGNKNINSNIRSSNAATEVQQLTMEETEKQETEKQIEESSTSRAVQASMVAETQQSMTSMDLEDPSMQPTQEVMGSQSQLEDSDIEDNDDDKVESSQKSMSKGGKVIVQPASKEHDRKVSSGKSNDEEDDGELLDMDDDFAADNLEMSQSQNDNDGADSAQHSPKSQSPSQMEKFPDILDTGDAPTQDIPKTIFSLGSDKMPAHVSRVVLPPGRSGLAVNADAELAFAAGSLGIRLLDVNTREVLKDIGDIDNVLCVDAHPVKSTQAACGGSGGHVNLITIPSDRDSKSLGRISKLLYRAPGPVRAVAFSPNGQTLAIGTDENIVRLMNLASQEVKELKGHSAAIKSLAWSPEGDFLASVATNGQVIVWAFAENKLVKKFDRLALADTEEDPAKSKPVQLAWSRSGKTLAVAGLAGVELISSGSWTKIQRTAHTSEAKDHQVQALAWSPNDKYIVYADTQGDLALINVQSKDSRILETADGSVSDRHSSIQVLSWPKKRHGVLALSMDGNVHWYARVVPSEIGNALEVVAEKQTPSLPKSGEAAQKKGVINNDMDLEELDDDDDDPKNSISQIRKDHGLMREDNEENDREGDSVGDVDDMGDELDMNDDDDLDRNQTTGFDSSTASRGVFVKYDELEGQIKSSLDQLLPRQPQRQPVLMPGATPETEERRFLAWNSIGSITFRSEDTHNSVEIDFANSVDHRRVRFSDHYGFTMAALGASGAIFATPGQLGDSSGFGASSVDQKSAKDTDWTPELPEDGLADEIRANQNENGVLRAYMDIADQADAAGVNPDQLLGNSSSKAETLEDRLEARFGAGSTVFYKSFDSRSNNSDWTAKLPSSEKVRAVAAGASFAAVATNQRTLRIFRPSGLQEAPLRLPGPVLSMVGAGVFLLVVCHTGAPSADGTQQLSYQLINVGMEGTRGGGIQGMIASGQFPMPHGEEKPLKWLGMTDKTMGYMPACLDSKGTFMVLSKAMGWNWVPVLSENSLRRSKHDVVWPVSIQLGKLNAIVLKGKGKHLGFPETYPRPVLSSYELCVPVAGLKMATGSLKYKLEENSVRSHLVLNQVQWVAKEVAANDPDAAEFRLTDQKLAEEEAQLDAKVLKHLILAIKLNRSARAFGLVKRLRLERSLQIAHQQAQQAGADFMLLQRIENLIAIREALREAEDDDEDDESSDESDGESEMEEEVPRRQQSLGSNKMRKRLTAKSPSTSLQSLSINEPSDSEEDVQSEAGQSYNKKKNLREVLAAESGSESIDDDDDDVIGKGASAPTKTSPNRKRNPFAIARADSTKSRTSDEGPQSLMSAFNKAPVLTPKLNRQSTFTQEALGSSKSKKQPTSASKRRRI